MKKTIPEDPPEILVNETKCFPGRENEISHDKEEQEIGKGESKMLQRPDEDLISQDTPSCFAFP